MESDLESGDDRSTRFYDHGCARTIDLDHLDQRGPSASTVATPTASASAMPTLIVFCHETVGQRDRSENEEDSHYNLDYDTQQIADKPVAWGKRLVLVIH